MKNITSALLAAQKEMGNPTKGSSNPYFKSKYADLNSVLEAVVPVLNKHGIVVLQPTTFVDGKPFVKTLLIHESGEMLEGLTEIVYKNVGDAQGQGAGITYARRYGLQSMANVGADDDDGNRASGQSDDPYADAANCNTVDELQEVWTSNPKLHGIAKFKNAVKAKKAELA